MMWGMSPKRIAVIGLKGGVGKTTMTVMLSQAAADAGEVVTVIDADPQGSATAWATNAGDDLAPTVIGQASAGLARTIDRLDAGSTVTVIDTPPHEAGGAGAITAAALAVADLAIVPVTPAALDLDRLAATVALATQAGVPAAVVINRARGGTRSRAEVVEALTASDLPVAGTVIPQREALAQAPLGGKPPAKATGFAELWAEIKEVL